MWRPHAAPASQPLTRRGAPRPARSGPRCSTCPAPRALGGGPDRQALQQRVHRRRHAVEAAQQHDLAVEELGLDRARPRGRGSASSTRPATPPTTSAPSAGVAPALPVLLGAGHVDARRRQRLLALALRLPGQRAEPALGPGQSASTALARFIRSLRYFQRMMSGRATDWKVVVAMASAMAWPRLVEPRREAAQVEQARDGRRVHLDDARGGAGWPGTSRTCRRCAGSGAAPGARSPRRSACRRPAWPAAPRASCVERVSVCCPLTASRTTGVLVGVPVPGHLRPARTPTGMGRVTVSSGASRTRPDSRARPCSPRATRVTSKPRWNRRAPTAPPMAPAPTTTKRMEMHSATCQALAVAVAEPGRTRRRAGRRRRRRPAAPRRRAGRHRPAATWRATSGGPSASGRSRPPIATDPDEAYLPPGGMARRVHADLPAMLIGGVERAAAADAAPAGHGRRGRALGLPGGPAGPAAPDRVVRRHHDLRHGGRGGGGHRPGPAGASPGQGHRPPTAGRTRRPTPSW